jgi:hypothetical protein
MCAKKIEKGIYAFNSCYIITLKSQDRYSIPQGIDRGVSVTRESTVHVLHSAIMYLSFFLDPGRGFRNVL